jgi:hypothetical protein
MENFAPGLRETIVGLANDLRFVVFFLCVVGFMVHVHRARPEVESLLGPLVRAIVITGLVATLPYWFGLVEKMFLSLADHLSAGYSEHPMETAGRLRDTVADSDSAFTFRRIGESLYKAFLFASAKLVVLVASLLQLPFLLLQYILKLLCYLFLPIALGLMMVPALASLGMRYVQQTIAVLAWPVGFAVTELVAYHLLTAYATNLAAAYGLRPGDIDAASFGSLLGGLLAALWLIIGTLGTPFLMQSLICSGAPLTGGGQSALQQAYMLHQVAWLVKSLKTAGAAAKMAQAGGSSGSSATPPPPPPPPPSVPPPAPAPATPPPAADPSGDQRAAAAFAATQLPTAQTTI